MPEAQRWLFGPVNYDLGSSKLHQPIQRCPGKCQACHHLRSLETLQTCHGLRGSPKEWSETGIWHATLWNSTPGAQRETQVVVSPTLFAA